MAVVNTKSTAITNQDADPIVLNNRTIANAPGYQVTSIVAKAASDSDGSVYRLIRLNGRAVINKIDLLNTAITGGTVYHLGVYQTAKNGGAIVGTGKQFADTVTMASARTNPIDLRHFTAALTTGEKKLYEILGLTAGSAASKRDYDICLTAATAGTDAATFKVTIYWTQDGN